MVASIHIIKKCGGKHESDPKERTKGVWSYPSAARILSAISSGYDTTKLLSKEAGIPYQTVHKFLKILRKENILFITNQNDFNRRQGKGLEYTINYKSLVNKLIEVIHQEAKKQEEYINTAIKDIEKTEKNVAENIKKNQVKLKNIRLSSTEKDNIKRKLSNLEFSKKEGLPHTKKKLEIHLKDIHEVLPLNKEDVKSDKIDIEMALNSLLYLNFITHNQKRTILDIIYTFLDYVKTGKLEYFPIFPKLDMHGITSIGWTDISEEQTPFLNSVKKMWSLKDSLKVLF